jgi:undecaprenyl-diphosphatase
VCNLWLKPWVGRLRPFDYQLQCYGRVIPLLIQAPTDFSFPSGHTIASFEAAAVLWLQHRKWGIAAMILAVCIAFSRLYLYVHYPTDVFFAMLLGIGIGLLASMLTRKISVRNSRFFG